MRNSGKKCCAPQTEMVPYAYWGGGGAAGGMGGNPGGGGGGTGTGTRPPHDFECGGHNIKCPPPPTFLW